MTAPLTTLRHDEPSLSFERWIWNWILAALTGRRHHA